MRQVTPSGEEEVTPITILTEMRRVLPSADAWHQGRLAVRSDGTHTVTTDLACVARSLPGAMHCALAFHHKWRPGLPAIVEGLLSAAAGRPYDLFDADPHTAFADVERVLDVATTMA